MDKLRVVILAAGRGTRMKSETPKALVPVKGKSMVLHVLHEVALSGIDNRPVIVVGFEKEKLMKELGEAYDYAVQREQLGTGHALGSTEELLKDKTKNILVLPSDHPFVSAETMQKLVKKHLESGAKLTLATALLPDFNDWRKGFYNSFSRIIRNDEGKIVRDVQVKDATEEEKKIKEVNPIYFCFNAAWLWENIKYITTNNAQKEYYMTDLVQIAIKNRVKIESISIDPFEALAANSKEELEILEKLAK